MELGFDGIIMFVDVVMGFGFLIIFLVVICRGVFLFLFCCDSSFNKLIFLERYLNILGKSFLKYLGDL